MKPQTKSVSPHFSEDEMAALFELVHSRYHYDFRGYAMSSLRRRLGAALSALRLPSIGALERSVSEDPVLFAKLLQYLTVQTSDMFRDPSFFRVLRERIVPTLATYPFLKVWVAGCSTGEELYSLAIVLREESLLERTMFYATDINPEALRKAEAGIYSIDRLAGFSEGYRQAGGRGSLSDYYSAAYGSAVFDRSLRKNVVFSDHSLATDSVFAEVELVSCRNVLIYFDRVLQERATTLMRDALCRKGFLGLGSRETLLFSSSETAFEELVPGERWYRKC